MHEREKIKAFKILNELFGCYDHNIPTLLYKKEICVVIEELVNSKKYDVLCSVLCENIVLQYMIPGRTCCDRICITALQCDVILLNYLIIYVLKYICNMTCTINIDNIVSKCSVNVLLFKKILIECEHSLKKEKLLNKLNINKLVKA